MVLTPIYTKTIYIYIYIYILGTVFPSEYPSLHTYYTIPNKIIHVQLFDIVNTKRNICIVTNNQVPLRNSPALLSCQTHSPA